MPTKPKKRFALEYELKELLERARAAFAENRETRFLPLTYVIEPTEKGCAAFVTMGSLESGYWPDREDLSRVIGCMEAEMGHYGPAKRERLEAAVMVFPPNVRYHRHQRKADEARVFHLVVGSMAHGFFPNAEDLRAAHKMASAALKGHGRCVLRVSAESILSDDKSPRHIAKELK